MLSQRGTEGCVKRMSETYLVYADELKAQLLNDNITKLVVYGDDGKYVEYHRIQWIPCSERLPERPERVQIQMKNSWIITGYYDGEAWYPVPDDGVPMDDEYVKAWCELPEPYKENK